MTLKCYLLTLLKIHRPDCEPCKALEKGGIEMRERLEELNSEPQPSSLSPAADEKFAGIFDPQPCDVVARMPIRLMQQPGSQKERFNSW